MNTLWELNVVFVNIAPFSTVHGHGYRTLCAVVIAVCYSYLLCCEDCRADVMLV